METKPAIYCSEFWYTLLANGIGVVNLLGWWNFASNRDTVFFMAIITAAYLVSRGLAKNKGGFDPNNPGNYMIIPSHKKVTNRNR